MVDQKPTVKNFSATLAWWVVQVLWWLGVVSVVVFGLVLIVCLGGARDASYEVPLPASVSVGESLASEITVAGYDGIRVTGLLGDAPLRIRLTFCLMLAIATAMFFTVVRYLRMFVRSIRERHPFDSRNPRYLKIMGYVLVVSGPLYGLAEYAVVRQVSELLASSSYTPVASYNPHVEEMLLGLFVLVIALAFEAGARLQRDQDLTV